jgi:hypothetical protein
MERAFDGALSLNPHYYQIRGRAAEIARALGRPVGGAEHLFLGCSTAAAGRSASSHAWSTSATSRRRRSASSNGPGYACPPAPRFPAGEGFVQTWGADIAVEMGDAYIGVEHAFLAMIRSRETVPARALASLADLDAVEAAVLEAKNAPAAPGEAAVLLPEGQELDGPLERAIIDALPEGATFGFNHDGEDRRWMVVLGPGGSHDPGVTREVLDTALASLGRPAR